MNWTSAYFEINLMLVVTFILFFTVDKLSNLIGLNQKNKLGLLHWMVLLSVLSPFIFSYQWVSELPRPSVQRFNEIIATTQANLQVSNVKKQLDFVLDREFSILNFKMLLGILVIVLCLKWIRELISILYSLKKFTTVKKIGRVKVLIGENTVPYSFWLGNAYVVLPQNLSKSSFLSALKHELQHHRQRDTFLIHFYQLFRNIFFFNPAIYFLSKKVGLLQEFACDEALLVKRRVSLQAYSRCLLEVAEKGLKLPSHTVAMGTSAKQLKRRINMMFDAKNRKSKKVMTATIAAFTFLFFMTSAYAARKITRVKIYSLPEIKALISSSNEGVEIPLTVNDLVLDRLNHYLGTEEGRAWLKNSLGRMPQYKTMIDKKISDYHLPAELLAVPLWESGFDNSAVSSGMHAKGIWQFIAPTARRYGLIVNDQLDERVNPEKETDAGMRYLKDLNNIFQDWRLALKAYNEGERRVIQLITKYNTRDPWELEHLSTTESYLSGVMAMMIIMKYPSLME